MLKLSIFGQIAVVMYMSQTIEHYLCMSSLDGGRNNNFLCEKRDLTLFSKSWSASCNVKILHYLQAIKTIFCKCSLHIHISTIKNEPLSEF